MPEGGGENAGRDCLGRRDREESMCFYPGRLLRQLPRGLGGLRRAAWSAAGRDAAKTPGDALPVPRALALLDSGKKEVK